MFANRAFINDSYDTENLRCNTEKDKIKLHDRSAGNYMYTLHTMVVQ